MSEHAVVPNAIAMAKTLTALLGKETKVKAIGPWPVLPKDNNFYATYDDGAGELECVWISDLPLSATFGAALTLIPAGIAKETIQAKVLNSDFIDNAREIANITANSFQVKRVRLTQFIAPGTAIPADVDALITKPAQRVDFQVDVTGYPSGRLTLLGVYPPAPST